MLAVAWRQALLRILPNDKGPGPRDEPREVRQLACKRANLPARGRGLTEKGEQERLGLPDLVRRNGHGDL
eukprot:15479849-Alexandrium_andersonii.AAC.1